NLYQLLRAMNRFIPLLPPVPNVAARLGTLRSGQLQARENIRREFVDQVASLFDEFLAGYSEEGRREEIWQSAAGKLDEVFNEFNVEGLSQKALKNQQGHLKNQIDIILRDLLLESLSARGP